MTDAAPRTTVTEAAFHGEPVHDPPEVFEPEVMLVAGDADDRSVAIEYARAAQNRRDWPEAIRRWQAVRGRFPDELAGYIEAANCLGEVGQGAEKEALYGEASERFPQSDRAIVELAWLAHHRRDWSTALKRWKRVHERFPGHLTGYLGRAFTLSLGGRANEADALLETGLGRDLDHRELLLAYARQAQQRGDIATALARWERMRARFPDDLAGYVGGASCLHDAGRADEADALIDSATIRFPQNPDLALEYARLAHRRHDWVEATRRWAALRERFPDHLAGYIDGSNAMLGAGEPLQAEALLEIATSMFPDNVAVARCWAEFAERRQAPAEALQRWELMRRRFPAEAEGYVGAAFALEMAGRGAEAEAVLAEGRELCPSQNTLILCRAELATRRQDWAEAVERWAEIRARLPREARGYVEGARALAELLRFAECDAVLDEALALFPETLEVRFTWAHLAPRFKTSEEVLARWQRFRDQFPTHPAGYTFGAWYLQELGRADEAEALAAEALARFPAELEAARMWADIAFRRGEPEIAAVRFRQALDRFPSDPRLVKQLIGTLMVLRRHDDAGTELERARAIWPHDGDLLRQSIELAKETGRYEDAFALWDTIAGDANVDERVKLDVGWFLFRQALPPQMAEQVLSLLGAEKDPGGRDWLPRLAALVHLGGRNSEAVELARQFVLKQPATDLDPATLAVLKRDLLIGFSEAETLDLIRNYVASGRAAMTAHLFSDVYWRADPSRFAEIVRAFETYMDRKWSDSGWLRAGNEVEILSYLIFAAIFSHAQYRRLASAARQLFVLRSDNGLTTPADVLASMVNFAVAGTDVTNTVAVTAPRRLRIAVCVSGQLRCYREAFSGWSMLGLDEHETTYFVHVWKDVGRNWRRIWLFTRDLYPQLYATLAEPSAVPLLYRRYPSLAKAVVAADAEVSDLTELL